MSTRGSNFIETFLFFIVFVSILDRVSERFLVFFHLFWSHFGDFGEDFGGKTEPGREN